MIETAEYPTEPLRGATVDRLGWLAGHWLGRRGDEQIEESWGALLGGTMMGMFRWVRDSEPFAIGPDEAVFHQQGVAEPPWMVYRRSVDGTLTSYFQLPGKPVPDDTVFRYQATTVRTLAT